MTKEYYMRLPKARLAELLAERDTLQYIPLQTWQNPCADPSYPCMNPFGDCINCPRRGSEGIITTTDTEFKDK